MRSGTRRGWFCPDNKLSYWLVENVSDSMSEFDLLLKTEKLLDLIIMFMYYIYSRLGTSKVALPTEGLFPVENRELKLELARLRMRLNDPEK